MKTKIFTIILFLLPLISNAYVIDRESQKVVITAITTYASDHIYVYTEPKQLSKSSGHSRTITIQENGKDVEIGVVWNIADGSYRLYDATKAEKSGLTRRLADRPANDDWSIYTSNARRRYIKMITTIY